MDNRSTDKLFMKAGRRAHLFAAALTAFAGAGEMAAPRAFAQQERVLGSTAYTAQNHIEQDAFIHSLGSRPVLDTSHPVMNHELANQSVVALGSRVNPENAAVLVETLTYIGNEHPGGLLEQRLGSAPVDRTTGDSQWVDVTADVEGVTAGIQVPEGFKVELRRAAVDSRRVVPGMTYRTSDTQIGFDSRNMNIGGERNGQSTTGIEMRMTPVNGRGQLFLTFDKCGNVTVWEEAPAVPAQRSETGPCVNLEVTGLPRTYRGSPVEVRATSVEMFIKTDGSELTPDEVHNAQVCAAETLARGYLMGANCDTCQQDSFLNNARRHAKRDLKRSYPALNIQDVNFKREPVSDVTTVRADSDGRLVIRVPRQNGEPQNDPTLFSRVLCFYVVEPGTNRVIAIADPMNVTDADIRNRDSFSMSAIDPQYAQGFNWQTRYGHLELNASGDLHLERGSMMGAH